MQFQKIINVTARPSDRENKEESKAAEQRGGKDRGRKPAKRLRIQSRVKISSGVGKINDGKSNGQRLGRMKETRFKGWDTRASAQLLAGLWWWWRGERGIPPGVPQHRWSGANV